MLSRIVHKENKLCVDYLLAYCYSVTPFHILINLLDMLN